MPVKLTLATLLTAQSLLVASLWWLLLVKLQQSSWLNAKANIAIMKLPNSVQQRLANFAVTQAVEKPVPQWVVLRVCQLVSFILLVVLPVTGMFKLGFLVAIIWFLLYQRAERKHYIRRILREWPSALDMLAMLMHSGLSFRAALHAFQSAPSDSVALLELSRVQRAQQSGYTLPQALDALSVRIPHAWIKLFVGAVKQSQSTGGELAKTLQRQAEQCRQQQLLEAEKRAQEVSVKLMFPLIFCFFPVTMLLILGPVFIGFMKGGIA